MATTEQDSLDSGNSIADRSGNVYEIKVRGILNDHWKSWFEGMSLPTDESANARQGCTLLVGAIADQDALPGILERTEI